MSTTEVNGKYEAVIGLEVHAQLLTKSKAFCGCSAEYGNNPNTNTCPVCLGHPGALPVLNRSLVESIVKMGLATNCHIRPRSTFARKNYFYPDLPKGYQISQFEDPICYGGALEVETEAGPKTIGITRIHMEEDAGKSIHDLDIDTLIDLNRCGVPLIEIVSEPDMRTAAEAYKYLMQIKQIVMYLRICTGNMEEGALRCDANVSVRLRGAEKFGTKAEVKNLNSFRNVEKAIEYEIARQIELIESGEKVSHETRMWDGQKQITRPMRSKEMAHDYRYFPEPDLVAVDVRADWLDDLRLGLPELPQARKKRFIKDYSLPAYDAGVLVESRELADYFERCAAALEVKDEKRYKLTSNWVMTEVLRLLSERNICADELDLKPAHVAELVELFAEEAISSRIAKDIFPEVLEKGTSPREIVESRGLRQVSDTGAIEAAVIKIIEANQDSVEKYRSGRTNVLGFFVGQVMKATGGKANPKIVTDLVKSKLEA
ncbi:MAG: Asp-tRNA(Asn)/Glu-tRNA(Gln) amidotransferase subunit GatB [Chloroflexota bacterium]